MADFVEVPFETDAITLADDAVEKLTDTWEDYTPNDGDLEVVMIETIAPMAEAVGDEAALVPSAIFRAYGTDLVGLPYLAGNYAEVQLTFELIDEAGYTIPAGTEVDVDGTAFQTDLDAIVAPGDTSVTGVVAHATFVGSEPNGTTGAVVEMITALAFVQTVSAATTPTGGEDEEEDLDYQDRLSRQLELQATTLVTTRDFELLAFSKPEVGRAVAVHNGARSVTVTLTNDLGEVVTLATKDELVALYADLALVNTVVTMADASYTTITVTYTVHLLPGEVAANVIARADEALAIVLNPATWGSPRSDVSSSGWVNDPVVRKNKLIDVLSDVQGVDYVIDLSIAGSAGSAVYGPDPHTAVKAVDKGNFAVFTVPGSLTVDGQVMATGDRFLLTDQNNPAENGIWVYNGPASVISRATDADAAGELRGGSAVYVNAGTVNGGTTWAIVSPSGPITPGTTDHQWSRLAAGEHDWAMPGVVALPRSGTHVGSVA